jgi:hypothetical protein
VSRIDRWVLATGADAGVRQEVSTDAVEGAPAMMGAARRAIAGGILIVLGFWLFSAMTRSASGSGIVGFVLLAAWTGAGFGVIAGHPTGRLAGLALAAVGIIVGLSLALGGVDSPVAPWFFSTADAIRWYVVQPVGAILAVVSALAGFLLIEPFKRTTPVSTPGLEAATDPTIATASRSDLDEPQD